MMTATEIGAWVTAVGGICTALGALAGVFIKTRTDAYVKRKQADTDAAKIMAGVHSVECQADDDRADRAYAVVIAIHEKRIAALEAENTECRKENSLLRQSNSQLTERQDYQQKRIDYLEKKLNNMTG